MKRKMPSKVQAVRKLDNVGRISLPPKFLDYLDLSEGDDVLIHLVQIPDTQTGELKTKILMKKYPTGCVLCGNTSNLITLSGFEVCSSCRGKKNVEKEMVINRYEKQAIPNSRRMVIPFKVRNDMDLHVYKEDTEEAKESQENDKVTLELHEDHILMYKYAEEE